MEPGESKDIFMPLVPNMVQGTFNFTVSAWCFLERDIVTRTIYVSVSGSVLSIKYTYAILSIIKHNYTCNLHLEMSKFHFKYQLDLFTITALLLSKMIKFGKFKSVNN